MLKRCCTYSSAISYVLCSSKLICKCTDKVHCKQVLRRVCFFFFLLARHLHVTLSFFLFLRSIYLWHVTRYCALESDIDVSAVFTFARKLRVECVGACVRVRLQSKCAPCERMSLLTPLAWKCPAPAPPLLPLHAPQHPLSLKRTSVLRSRAHLNHDGLQAKGWWGGVVHGRRSYAPLQQYTCGSQMAKER